MRTSLQNHHHILVVNAPDDLARLYEDMLREEGYCVTLVPALPDDLETIQKLRPDLLILDDTWNVTDDRLSPLQRLADDPRTKNLPIVLCTGAVRQVQPLMPYLDGKNITIVFKPFDVDHLLSLISTSLMPSARIMSQPDHRPRPADLRD